jgi:hypothetical protein
MLHLAHDRVSRYVAMSLSVPYWMYEVGRFAFYALFVMAIAGVLVVRRLPLWMWLTPLLFFALGAATAGLIRYRWPSDLFLVLPASAAIARLATGRGSEPRSELRAP